MGLVVGHFMLILCFAGQTCSTLASVPDSSHQNIDLLRLNEWSDEESPLHEEKDED